MPAECRFAAKALAGHLAVGLAVSALIYLVCLTGTLAVFTDEFRLLEQRMPAATTLPPGQFAPGALDRAIDAALATGNVGTLYVVAPYTGSGRMLLTAYGETGERSWLADGAGEITPARTPWIDFVDDLHMNLTAPAPWGPLAIGLIGVALLSLIVSGVLAHPRIVRDAFRLRLGAGARLREAELHNRMSVWGLPFHLAVTLTGAFFGNANLTVLAVAALAFHGDTARVYQSLTGPAVTADAQAAPLPDIEALVARATAEIPGSALYYVGLERPGTAGMRVRVEVTGPGRLPRGEHIFFDAKGDRIGHVGFVTGSPGLQVYSGAAQIHFGFWGGLPVRVAYGILGAALTWISASGIRIWLARRRDQGRAAPALERAWSAWLWGVPGALAAALLLSAIASVGATFWTVLALAQIGALLSPLTRLRHNAIR